MDGQAFKIILSSHEVSDPSVIEGESGLIVLNLVASKEEKEEVRDN